MMGRYFSDKKINAGRQPELDLLKALCILGMIIMHVILDLQAGASEAGQGQMFTELFGAATFMISMGIGMRYTRHQSAVSYLVRGFGLLTIGQFLNILRNVIPNLIAYWITGKQLFIANVFLILQADILTFAGLSFLLMAVFRKCRLKGSVVLAISVIMSLISLILWKTTAPPSNYLASQFAGFFVITNAESYFPLLNYFIFVAFGYFIGGYYPRIKDKNGLANRVMIICFPLTVIYYGLRFGLNLFPLPTVGTDLQYSLKPTPDAVMTCVFSLGLIAFLYKITRLTGGRLPKFIMHLSRYINSYYCLSYLFILPVQTILVAARGELIEGLVWLILYSLFVIAACFVLIELNERYWHIRFASLRGRKLLIFTVSVWVLTVVSAAYAYPRIEVFANIWNDYLLP